MIAGSQDGSTSAGLFRAPKGGLARLPDYSTPFTDQWRVPLILDRSSLTAHPLIPDFDR